jgi:signal transduction histidine kinase
MTPRSSPRDTVDETMKGVTSDLAREYGSILQAYLQSQDEACLQRAYELGREAMAADLGILQFAEMHDKVLARILTDIGLPDSAKRALKLGQGFLMEALSPFELSQRQSRDASLALRRLNETLEAEVKRIALSLHDEAAQLLVSADLAVDEVAWGLSANVRDRLEKIRAPLRQCAAELRRLSHELRPPILDELGLMPALEFLAQGVSHRIGLPISVVGSVPSRFPPPVETAVYRSVQEALANVAKHAHASAVTIEARETNKALQCVVRDDGQGFDASTVLERAADRGLGLIAIRERLGAVGGSYELVTLPGKGTELLFSIPVVESHGHTRTPR